MFKFTLIALAASVFCIASAAGETLTAYVTLTTHVRPAATSTPVVIITKTRTHTITDDVQNTPTSTSEFYAPFNTSAPDAFPQHPPSASASLAVKPTQTATTNSDVDIAGCPVTTADTTKWTTGEWENFCECFNENISPGQIAGFNAVKDFCDFYFGPTPTPSATAGARRGRRARRGN